MDTHLRIRGQHLLWWGQHLSQGLGLQQPADDKQESKTHTPRLGFDPLHARAIAPQRTRRAHGSPCPNAPNRPRRVLVPPIAQGYNQSVENPAPSAASLDSFIRALREALQRELPGSAAQQKMAPPVHQAVPLSPAPARQSAVLALLHPAAGASRSTSRNAPPRCATTEVRSRFQEGKRGRRQNVGKDGTA